MRGIIDVDATPGFPICSTNALMQSRYLLGLGPHGFHRIHYVQWGDAHSRRVLICVHGLTRTARDFDFLAAALSDVYRVVCPDMPGRGRSEWLVDKSDYGYPVYLNDTAALLARTGADQVDWIGTSMGGLIGMMLAAQPGSPIRRLVMNDIGPFIPKEGLARIAGYVGRCPTFTSMEALEQYLRTVAAPFGPLTAEQWRHLTVHNARVLNDGSYTLAYDPGIADSFKGAIEDVDLWSVWDAVRCPVLVLRGAESDVLTHQDAKAMGERGPRAHLIEFPGIGHAPALMTETQIAAVKEWLID